MKIIKRILLAVIGIVLVFSCRRTAKMDTQTPEKSPEEQLVEIQKLQQVLAAKYISQEKHPFEMAQAAMESDTIEKRKRIINGQPAFPKEIPWQVALIVRGSEPDEGQFCGGSIIADRWILTACHCVEGLKADQIQVYSGSINLKRGGKVSNVKSIYEHQGYSERTLDNDIALIELEQPIQFSDDSNPIELVNDEVNNELQTPGQRVTVSGWGVTETGSSTSGLRKVKVDMISDNSCSASYGRAVTTNMFCAGFDTGGADACQGDSGGPLFAKAMNETNYLMGIVSWGEGCAVAGFYGVYTRIYNYLDWINDRCNCVGDNPSI